MGPPTSPGPVDPLSQFRSYLNVLADPASKDESKLKAVQELNENLEAVIASPLYAQYLEHSMKIFLRILQDGEPHFIAEYNIQQVRKLVLEIIHRLPTNDAMKPFVKQLLALMFKEVETDNEENVLVCLRIIIELHKQFRPPYSTEIPAFLALVKSIYRNLPNHVAKIFEPKMPLKVRDLSDLNLEALLSETYTITTVQTEVKTQDGTNVSYNVLPRASMSLKVLQELPIIVVLMYQLYKANIHADVAEFIPLIMNTITMAPSQQLRNSPSFQKEIFVDFMGAQIKTLSFMAYIMKYYQDAISQQANAMVKGVLSMLVLCPMEVAHLRKELLIAARHVLATDLKVKFVPVMERLFDENLLLGKGWTANETLRPLAYSTVADLVHHVRTQLPLVDLQRAVYLFSRNVHDDTLPVNIQTMSVKLLLNLVDCIHRRSEIESGNGRDLLVRLMETFVLKLKSIVKHQLPILIEKNKAASNGNTPVQNVNATCSTPSVVQNPLTPATPSPASPSSFVSPATPMAESIKSEDVKGFSIDLALKEEKDKVKFGFPTSQVPNYTVNDCRGLVKTLVCAVKTATWGCTSTKGNEAVAAVQATKSFQPKETLLFIRLVKWGLQALDVYTLNGTSTPPVTTVTIGANGRPAPPPQQSVRTKDEKEALEHFAGVFSMLSPQNFKEIFSTTIEFFVERVYKNFALQLVANSFLANQATSSIFATILVEYLLAHMEDMGASIERSNLYLKLFKLVFGSVQLFAQENEQMLKPYLHKIVNRSMELALTAKEPYNYFLLLRALFRSIGGGSHDLLYQEFLPLLPTLLQGLNSLQSGLHKQHMKDLFVELCLTVPVRLSSLLPYLPMLMDPLVSALNGSQTLVSQGLRTLELCVDNLQPDFLYEHIQPVRAELMQALWRTLRSSNDGIALSAFRVLGKFGGGNRKMLIEAQALEYNDKESLGPSIQLHFPEHKPAINLPVDKIIETAFNALKSSSTDPFYRRQCWETIRCYLACSLQLDDEKHVLQNFLTHQAFMEGEIYNVQTPALRCNDLQARKTQQTAVTAMFIAAAIKELRQSVLKTMVALVRHYTLVAIAQQAGPFPIAVPGKPPSRITGLDPVVLIDALATIMGHEEKELCKPGHLALVLILGTAVTVLGSKERACKLRFMECLAEKMCGLCYERAWYSKLGGCIAIKFLFERMSLKWVLDHQFIFLKALLFVMMDLSGEVSSGALDMAESNLEKMITLCATPLEPAIATDEMLLAQKKSLNDVTLELVRQVTSPNNYVREQAMKSLQLIAHLIGQTVTSVMEPHRDILADMIPPKKHLLRHQPVNAQIGLMDGNTFCTTLEPRLFTIDLTIMEHKVFFSELFSLCEAEDSALQKFPCYKSVTDLTPLRKSALRALAACHYVSQCKEKIFSLLYKSLSSTTPELQEAAFDCLKSFTAGCQVEMETVHSNVRQLLVHLNDFRQLTPNIIQRLSYTTQLFPNTFNEKLCEQMLQHLRKWLEVLIVQNKPAAGRSVLLNIASNEVKVATEIIALFHQIPAASARFLEILCKLVLQTERATGMEAGSPFRHSLMKFLLRYPQETIDLFLKEETVMDQQWSRYFHYMVKHIDGKELRDRLQFQTDRLIQMAITGIQPGQTGQTLVGSSATNQQNKASLLYQSIRVVDALASHDTTWLGQQHDLIGVLRKIWVSDEFQTNHLKIENVDYSHWKDAKTLVKTLLDYFKAQPSETDLLFDIMRCLSGHHVPDFQFVKEYLETQVWNYDTEWKRMIFFRFVEIFRDVDTSMEHKAILLQYIIIPCFATSFEKGEGEVLIGTVPMPEQDNPENLVSVFINRVVDPENPFGTTDAVRILLLQLSCLLVDRAAPHIHDAANKRQGNKLRRLMTFAWPCLLSKNCVDPTTRYHGHLLLSHIISKFAIHKRIVLQVFHSLLKAHAVEARTVVRQALEILTPAMPVRMEDGNTMLTHWTKKIIVEEGHSINQLVHILQLVVRHYKVYYPVRHHLVHHMVTSMQKLGFAPTASSEQKKLAVDLAEVVLKWEQQRIQEEQESEVPDAKKPKLQAPVKGENRPIEKVHADATVNFLLRLACQTAEASQATPTVASPQESISKRCVALLKIALRADVWPNVEFKLGWLERLFTATSEAGPAAAIPNQNSICTALEMMTFLLGILRSEQILSCVKPLQRGVSACMQSTNVRIIRAVHPLLMKLMQLFPTEPTNSNIASKHEELETLYASVSKYIYEGLNTFDKNSNALPSTLLGTLLMLKAACVNNVCYVDRLITSFMRVLHRLHREHVTPASTAGAENNTLCVELLITSLEIVKNRVGVMGMEMRKAFIGTILVGLIEKTPENKVMKTVVKMLDEWIRTKNTIEINQGPSLREKAILLVKLMQYVEKRFPDDLELNASFLELVNYIYRDEAMRGSELTAKLEPAFLAGLRCTQPHIRNKFFEVFDSSIKRKLFERLLYIVCSQNWEQIGPHYWIKQCVELIFVCANSANQLQSATGTPLLPSVTSVISFADPAEKAAFNTLSTIKEEPMDLDGFFDSQEKDSKLRASLSFEDEIDMELSNAPVDASHSVDIKFPIDHRAAVISMVNRQAKFLEDSKAIKTGAFLSSAAQLAHMETSLAETLWIEMFPRLWKVLAERHQQTLAGELVPFLCSGAHVLQKDCQPSALQTFVEALTLCSPPVPMKPCILKYLGKAHNLWHRMTLALEQVVFDQNVPGTIVKTKKEPTECYEFEPPLTPQMEIMDSLSELYSLLREEDLWASLWQRKAKYPETALAVAYEQMGFFEQAQGAFELATSKARQDYANNPVPVSMQCEYKLLEEHWIRCSKELNQWDLLQEYGSSEGASNPQLVLESSWRVPNWPLMKDALSQVELSCPKEIAWKVNLYRGFLAICHPEDQHLSLVERYVELASTLCIKEWRRLPSVVSHIHIPLLQAAQQVVELHEASTIHQGLLQNRTTSLHDMKAIVKTWRNRLPVIADDLSHWSDVFAWRQHHYQFIASHFEQQQNEQTNAAGHSMLGVHASALAIIHFGKIARKHSLTGVCLESLSRIYTIPSVPIVDCFQKIRQQVKCYLQMALMHGKNELQEGLEVIDSTNLKYFTKEMTAEFYAYKGLMLSQLGRSDDANKAFSAAVQLHDNLTKGWAFWGDYLEQVFTKDSKNLTLGVSAVTCYLHACRHQNEPKARKYLAKVLWLLSFDDDKLQIAEALDKYSVGVPAVHWLPWIPQLLNALVRNEGKLILNLLIQVGRMFPQAVYFPIRTLYLTLKIEQRERVKAAEQASPAHSMQPQTPGSSQGGIDGGPTSQESGPGGPIRATQPMWRCSRIMHTQRDLHPTVLSSLEGIVDQMVWFRESWYEEVLRQLRLGLAKCYAIAFETRVNVAEATITPHTLNFVRKLVSTFGIGIENIASSAGGSFSNAASESLARRAQMTAQDPVFQRMKTQFSTDFDFSQPGSMKLHNLIHKLKKWIKILEAKTKLLPKSFLIEEKCRFLSNFSQQTAEVEMPGEFLLPKHAHYFVRIARFLPRVEIVPKHNTAARRLYIRGHNGKIYPFLVVNDSCIGDARREERILQLFRMLNHYLAKQKETSRRLLHFTVPRVVAVSPQMRLVEDNPSSLSLLDIYRQRSAKRGIEHDTPVTKYYEKLASVQSRGAPANHQVLKDVFKEVQNVMVPKTLITDWATATFQSPTAYWSFRKMFTVHLALLDFAEYVFHLTRLNPDMMYVHQDSGLMNVAYFKWDMDDETGLLEGGRPVPFRLTPNLTEFVTPLAVSGPLTASMIATARCLSYAPYKLQAILRAMLRDEVIGWHRKKSSDKDGCPPEKDTEPEVIITGVSKAVSQIMNRLQSLSTYDGTDNKVSALVAAASTQDKLCLMDPAWHPWL